YPIGAGAEINPVEVEFENLLLGKLALEPERQERFLEFSREGALLRQEQILGKLLGQRRAALRHAPVQQVHGQRANNPERIDAVVRIEAAVLDGDEGLRQVRRQFLERQRRAAGVAARCQQAAAEVDDLDRGRALRDFE